MRFTDEAGNELVEGTPVIFPLGFGQSMPGTIAKLESGLGVGNDAVPKLCVMFIVPLAVGPHGRVSGVFAMAQPERSAIAA